MRLRLRVLWRGGYIAVLVLIAFVLVPSVACAQPITLVGQLGFPGSRVAGYVDGVSVSSSGDLAIASIQATGAEPSGEVPYPPNGVAPYVDVFTRSPGGWTSSAPSAVLSDSASAGLIDPVISDAFAVAPTAYGVLDVFTPGAAGWSGAITSAATLYASDHTTLVAAAISGDTVLAIGDMMVDRVPVRSVLYVFQEPPTGWSGFLTETARIPVPRVVDSPADTIHSLSTAGDLLIAGGQSAGRTIATGDDGGLVYTEPVGGWSALRTPSATLAPEPFTGAVTEYADDIYAEPGMGWHGLIYPSAQILMPGYPTSGSEFDDQALVLEGVDYTPGTGSLATVAFAALRPPSGGWRGTVEASSVLQRSTEDGEIGGDLAFALSGSDLFTPDPADSPGSALQPLGIYALGALSSGHVLTDPALAAHATIGNLTKRYPVLPTAHSPIVLTVRRPVGAPWLRTLKLELPSGIQVATATSVLARALTVVGAHVTRAHAARRSVTLSLAPEQSDRITVTLGPGAITFGTPLLRRLRAGLRVDRAARLTLTLVAIDDSGHVSHARITVKV